MILSNSDIRIEIAELGAELMHIRNLHTNSELLWNGDPTYWKRRSPILFPNVGKTFENKMLINGVTYTTSQHGFARDRVFVCEESGPDHATFLLRSDEETLKLYPFDFELRVRYALNGSTLTVTWSVVNTSAQEMSFTIGGHPAFCFDQPTDLKDEYCLFFPGKQSLRYVLLDLASGTAMPEAVVDLPLENSVLPLSDELFAKDALVLDDGQIDEVWLCRKDGSRRIGMRCPGFPNFGIWSVNGAPFVCLEPWMGRCDNRGFNLDISEKPNINRLAPGASFEVSYDLLIP